MILSDKAQVKELSGVAHRSLIFLNVGSDGNLFAITYKDTEEEQCIAVLSPAKYDGCPYEYEPNSNSVCVLDFGPADWFIDVEIKAGTENACPNLTGSGRGSLIRNGADYFFRLTGRPGRGGGYVNLTTGKYHPNLPRDSVRRACWNDFKIYMPQSCSKGQFLEPQLMLHWGELMEKKRAN